VAKQTGTAHATTPQLDPSVSRLLYDLEAARSRGCSVLGLTAEDTDVFVKLAIAVTAHQHALDVVCQLLGDPPALARLLKAPKSPPIRVNARGQRRPRTYKSAGRGTGTKRPASSASAG
jgi:hypothetical protein